MSDIITELISKYGGDGIDFDFEHISDNSAADRAARIDSLAKVMVAIRKKLGNKVQLGYTARYNAFWTAKDRPACATSSNSSDGEGIDLVNAIKRAGMPAEKVLDWANLMIYDCANNTWKDGGATPSASDYITCMDYAAKYLPKNTVNAGFEPGKQAYQGKWEGLEVDMQVIDYIKNNGFGGIFFWAINDSDKQANCLKLAKYAAGQSALKNLAAGKHSNRH